MLDTVFTTISRYSMLAGGERVVAAVSGGCDSVCLLHVLADLAPRLGVTLAGVAHFNHKLRGDESEQDEQFVAGLASRHGVPFYRAEADLAAAEGNLEQEARRARQKFFRSLIREGKADRIALGHTRDDQAETVLLRLLRGSGLAGLAGILPVTREGFIRPLLDSTRTEVEAHLRSRLIEWREDRTNADPRFTRNRIRRDLLPLLASGYNPRISQSLAQFAEMARDEEAWWAGEIAGLAKKLFVVSPMGVEVRARDLAAIPKAAGRRLVRRALEMAKGDLRRMEFQHVETILALAMGPDGMGRARLPGITVTRSLDWLLLSAGHLAAAVDPIAVEVPGCFAWAPAHTNIILEVTERKGCLTPSRDPDPYATLEVEVCWNRVRGPLELRGWRSGDAYWPQGRTRVHQVRELFQDHRVPSWRRTGWPILFGRSASGQREIVWAREFGAAHELVGDADAGPVLRIWEKQESFAGESASY